ncbi:hypothetical protein Q1695_009611 [Nippostrongylus brasiliensis]|nr:hypothetical protein Q1695_009611 [Nippostrongylus brasiliensis]
MTFEASPVQQSSCDLQLNVFTRPLSDYARLVGEVHEASPDEHRPPPAHSRFLGEIWCKEGVVMKSGYIASKYENVECGEKLDGPSRAATARPAGSRRARRPHGQLAPLQVIMDVRLQSCQMNP